VTTLDSPDFDAPRLTPGTELVGPYLDSGLVESTYLVRKADGQMVQLSALLFTVLSGIDGNRSPDEIAAHVSTQTERTVSPSNISYLLDHKLAPVGLVQTNGNDAEPLPAITPHKDILVLRLRRTVLSARWVQVVARLFAVLFQPVLVWLTVIGLVVCDARILFSTSVQDGLLAALRDPNGMLIAMGLSIISMLFHEVGHAAACRYGGATPGKIGFGIFIVWPAFYTDVTDSYRLDRRGRLRVDLGGVYFNALFALGLIAAYTITESPVLILAIVIVHTEILQQLLPTLRLDGHLILADTIGVPDLFSRIWPVLRNVFRPRTKVAALEELKKSARFVVFVWVLATSLFIVAEVIWLTFAGPELAGAFLDTLSEVARGVIDDVSDGHFLTALGGAASLVILVLPAIGLTYVLAATVHQAYHAIAQRRKSQKQRR
jgi:putative peptide zinc metalloprotease protein